MITELEEKFYKTFGIIKAIIHPCVNERNCINDHHCGNCYYAERHNFYPPITDHILLELVCIANRSDWLHSCEKEALKEEVLEYCIKVSKDIKSDVRKLFEE